MRKFKHQRILSGTAFGLLAVFLFLSALPSARASAVSSGPLSSGSSAAASPSPHSSLSSSAGSAVPTSGPVNPIPGYELDIKSDSALVIETGRGMQLFMKNPGATLQIPLASKLMTALLAIEMIPQGTMITVSSVAAAEADAWVLSLKTGEKYSLEYLLHGLILKDNGAAAVALAEQVSGTTEKFVEQMNARADSYQMAATVFTNVTGAADSRQVTTVGDVAQLFRFALSYPEFESIFKTHDAVFIVNPYLTKHLISNISDVWSLSEGTTGVFRAESKSRSSYALTAKAGSISIFVIGATASKKDVVKDLTTITGFVFDDYEFSRLINEGQIFPQTMTVAGKTFSLQFHSDVNYVHPKSMDFIYDTVYEPQPAPVLPVLTAKAAASVTFILLDGTKIKADLFPTVDIWGDSSLYRRVLDIYSNNRDIGNLILISSCLLLLAGLVRLMALLIRSIRRASVRRR